MGRCLLWVFGTAFVAAALTFVGGITLPEIVPISQFEGAYMMAVAFIYTPTGFVAGAVLGFMLWRSRTPRR